MQFGHRHWKSRLGDTACPSVAEPPSCPDEHRTNWLKFACSRPAHPANRPPRSPIHPSSVNRTETRTRDPPVLSPQWHRIQFWYGTPARAAVPARAKFCAHTKGPEFLCDLGYCLHQKRWLSVFAACNDCSAGYSSQRCLRIRRRCPTAHGVIRQILALCYPPLLIQSSLIADFLPKKGYYLNLSLQKHRTYAPAHCLSN